MNNWQEGIYSNVSRTVHLSCNSQKGTISFSWYFQSMSLYKIVALISKTLLFVYNSETRDFTVSSLNQIMPIISPNSSFLTSKSFYYMIICMYIPF